jgi:hypothetical protein
MVYEIWGCRKCVAEDSNLVGCDTMSLCEYRGADKSLARPSWKKHLKGRHFLSDAETWLKGQPFEFFSSGLQKLEFGRCSLFPSWSG